MSVWRKKGNINLLSRMSLITTVVITVGFFMITIAGCNAHLEKMRKEIIKQQEENKKKGMRDEWWFI